MSRDLKLTALLVCLLLVPTGAWAQGAMLHGVGPINSSMGGAGTALPIESLGALMYNPALITEAQGNQISFSSEFFEDGIQIKTTVGTLTGTENGTSQLGVVPAFGWMVHDPRKKIALGFGLIGIAGFRTDYAANSASILFAPPPQGFGRIYTNYQMTKIPIAFGYEVTPKLSLGLSVNIYQGEFAVAPLPYQVFDVDAAGNRYYPEAGSLSQSWAVAGQFGLFYKVTPTMFLGGSYTMPQHFSPYTWNSSIADPSSPAYGQPRTLSYSLGGPSIVSFGTGMKLSPKTQLAVDGMFTKYSGVAGFGSPGGIVDGIIQPFGWRSIWTVKAGIDQQLTPKLDVRAGYNYSQTPIRSSVVLTATGAPATFQNHYCAGFGLKMFPFLTAEASVYYVPREHVVGPFPNPQNVVIGTLDESNTLTSGLIGLNFRF